MTENNTNGFDYLGHFRLTGILAACFLAVSILCIILTKCGIPVFLFDYDYAGGVKLQVDLGEKITSEILDDAQDICTEAAGEKAAVAASGSFDTAIIVKTGNINSATRQNIVTRLGEKYGSDKVKLLATSIADTGGGLGPNGKLITVFLFAFLIIFAYLIARYGFSGACAGALCAIHNLMVMLLSYVLFRIEIGSATISAVLVSIGLSVVSLTVVFDSIRSLWKDSAKEDFTDVVCPGIARAVALNSKILLASAAVIIVLMVSGTAALRRICLPLLFANAAAWYASIFIGGPLWKIFGGVKVPKK